MDEMKIEDFLLLLLAESNGRIESETRIQKLAFLGIKEKGLPTFTEFVWEKYGPLSKALWKVSRQMSRQDLLNIKEEERVTSMGDSFTIRTFELTDKGRSAVSELKVKFADRLDSMRELYYGYGKLSLDKLLEYVHTAYSPSDL